MHTFSELHLEELRKYLELPNGVPSHDVFGDIFSRVDTAAVGKCFKLFTDSIKAGEGTDYVVALDGKTVRRSEDHEHRTTHIETACLGLPACIEILCWYTETLDRCETAVLRPDLP